MIPLRILIIFSFGINTLFGQIDDLLELSIPIQRYTTLDGLPSNETYHTIQDRKGYLWITTDKGVSRFNGYEFENFSTADGLIDNTIFNIYEAPNGKIWFTGYNYKLGYWDGISFKEYAYNDLVIEIKEKKRSVAIHDLAIDSSENVFIGFRGGGFVVIDPNGEILDEFSLKKMSYRGEPIDDSTSLKGKYFFNNELREFLYTSNNTKGKGFLFKMGFGVYPQCINIEILGNKMSNLYYSSRFTDVRFSTFDFYKGNFYLIQPDYFFKIIEGDTLISYHKEDVERIWFLNENISLRNDELFLLDKNLNIQYRLLSIKNEDVTDINIYKDNLVINTTSKGIILIPNFNLRTVIQEPNIKNVQAIFKKDSLIMIVSNANKNWYSIYKSKLNEIKKPPSIDVIEDITNSNFHSGVQVPGTNKINSLVNIEDKFYLVENASIITIKNKNYEQEDVIKIKTGPVCIHCFQNQIILGTQNGLNIITEDKYVLPFELNGSSFDQYRIQDMKSINDEILVIATRGDGLVIINKDSTYFISHKDGLPSNIINQLFQFNNTIWVATNNGACSIDFDKYTYEFKEYINLEHGINSPDIRQIFVDEEIIYLGFDNGISIINNEQLKKINTPIPIYLNKIVLNDSIILDPKESFMDFRYYENNFIFDYVGVAPFYKNNIEYRYKLEGLDEAWYYTNDRTIRYNSLPNGDYKFIVQAKNEKNFCKEDYPSFSFKIHKPFWTTYWFILLSILFIITVVSTIFSFYILTQKKRNKLLKDFDEVKQKALNAQMNPHFVYNSLNSIQNFILKSDKKEANKYLTKFSSLMRSTFENSKKKHIFLSDEITVLKEYLELESMRFENIFKYNFIIDPNIDLSKCMIPSLLIQPFLENAIWHGILNNDITINGKLDIELKLVTNILKITITDNGIGRVAAQKLKHTIKDKNQISSGIEITEKRIELLNSVGNKKFTFKVIDLYNDLMEPLGTQILFSIPYLIKQEDDKSDTY